MAKRRPASQPVRSTSANKLRGSSFGSLLPDIAPQRNSNLPIPQPRSASRGCIETNLTITGEIRKRAASRKSARRGSLDSTLAAPPPEVSLAALPPVLPFAAASGGGVLRGPQIAQVSRGALGGGCPAYLTSCTLRISFTLSGLLRPPSSRTSCAGCGVVCLRQAKRTLGR